MIDIDKKTDIMTKRQTRICKIDIGKVFGRLTIIERDKNVENAWLCKCACGKEVSVHRANITSGKTKSCGCLLKDMLKNRKNIPIKSDEEVAITDIYSDYKCGAKKRNIVFNISKEVFSKLVKDNCYYCGDAPANIYTGYQSGGHQPFPYNGIDRKDNNKGYIKGNVVTSCFICNYAKRGLTEEQFRNQIKKMYLNMFRKMSDKTPGLLLDELFTTNMKLWYAQEKVMDSSLSDEGHAKYGQEAQHLNGKRNKLIRSIDTLLDFPEDTVSFKTYMGIKEQ